MPGRWKNKLSLAAWAILGWCLAGAGCQTFTPNIRYGDGSAPHELAKASLAPYVLEPPDILLIDTVKVIPKPPYKITPLDGLLIQIKNEDLEKEDISGIFAVEPEGTINLGSTYGSFQVFDPKTGTGLTLEVARKTIEDQIKKRFKNIKVFVSLGQTQAQQQIRGEHLVRPDGTVGLGTYGSVYVAGMTLEQARKALETHLGQFLLNPEISVDVFSYNSKKYYVIMDQGGNGELIYPLPVTGNETVLDALSLVGGLTPVASTHRIWIARPSPNGPDSDLILQVDWVNLTRKGRGSSNYQVLPGDRIYVQAQPMVTFETMMARLLQPIERAFGVTLLGSQTVRSLNGQVNSLGY
jgi:polysaccharide export outer membrane protein